MKVTVWFLIISCCFINCVWAPLPGYAPVTGLFVEKSRDALVKAYFQQDYSCNEIVMFLGVVHGISVCARTVRRILRRLHLRRRVPQTNERFQQALNAISIELEGNGSCLGYKSMWRRLKMKGIPIQRNVVRVALQMLDPEGVAQRKRKRLKRRMYVNPGPNFVWHIDGYDKLKPYGFAIHGAIDGFSRRVLWLNVGSSNNDPIIVARHFIDTVLQLKTLPCIVRGDRGTENVHVCRIQRYLRSQHTDEFSGSDSFLYGRSTSNQRIESWWSILRKQGMNFWMNLFKDMISAGLLDTSDVIHIHALRYCFMDLIQRNLCQLAVEWNQHRIQTKPNSECIKGKPDVNFFLPQNVQTESYAADFALDDVWAIYNELDVAPVKEDIDSRFVELVHGLLPNVEEPMDPADGLVLYSKILEAIENL